MSNDVGARLDQATCELVRHLTVALEPDALSALSQQVTAAIITESSPTMIDVEVPADLAPVALPNGPIPGSFMVYDDAGEIAGEILVWIKDGRFIGLEQAWYTEEPPTQWPDVAHVRLE